MRHAILAAFFLATAAFAQAPAPTKKLTLLVTGDARGEVAPCG